MEQDRRRIIANRKRLNRITVDLTRLLAERIRLVVEIGMAKKRLGIGIVDRARERKVIEKARKIARKERVDEELIEEIFRSIIRHSVRKQKGTRRR